MVWKVSKFGLFTRQSYNTKANKLNQYMYVAERQLPDKQKSNKQQVFNTTLDYPLNVKINSELRLMSD